MAPKVLVVGFRRGIAKALAAKSVPFLVWNSTGIKSKASPLHFIKAPLSHEAGDLDKILQEFEPYGSITHVIAGTEAAVLPAEALRKRLGLNRPNYDVVLACHDKLIMKDRLSTEGVPMTDYMIWDESANVASALNHLGDAIVIKERRSSGGRGIHFLPPTENWSDLKHADRMAERLIQGKEISVESFVHEGEIRFTNITDYYSPKFINLLPARLDLAVEQAILELNHKVISILGIQQGMTHLELYLTEQGPLFGEIALRPPGGYIMELLKMAYQFDPWEALVEVELGHDFPYPQRAHATVAAFVLHPGEGRVSRIDGKDSVEALPSVKKLKLKVKENDLISQRNGVGQDIGYVWMARPTYHELVEDVEFIKEKLKIQVS